LPQLWNILRGEMSLVGPRPERPAIAAQLQKVVTLYDERFRIPPGLTGLAQVQLPPHTDVASVRRKLACDLYYLTRQDLWLDLRLILSTALDVLAVPFGVSRALLRIPSGDAIASTYHSLLLSVGGVSPAYKPMLPPAQGIENLRAGQALENLISESELPPTALAN